MFSTLYWVDSHDKTLRRTSVRDGSTQKTVQLNGELNGNHIFGLAINGNNAYVTCWSPTVNLIKVDLNNGSIQVTGNSLTQANVFSAVFVSNQNQRSGKIYFYFSVLRYTVL